MMKLSTTGGGSDGQRRVGGVGALLRWVYRAPPTPPQSVTFPERRTGRCTLHLHVHVCLSGIGVQTNPSHRNTGCRPDREPCWPQLSRQFGPNQPASHSHWPVAMIRCPSVLAEHSRASLLPQTHLGWRGARVRTRPRRGQQRPELRRQLVHFELANVTGRHECTFCMTPRATTVATLTFAQ